MFQFASDASMTAMDGLRLPATAKPNQLHRRSSATYTVLDSNGNHITIGTATTDASGTYSLTWTPEIPGNYTVYATFAGTNGYWPSSAETHFYASPPSPTAAPTLHL